MPRRRSMMLRLAAALATAARAADITNASVCNDVVEDKIAVSMKAGRCTQQQQQQQHVV